MRGGRKEVKRRDAKRREGKQERVKLGGWGQIKGGDCSYGKEREELRESRRILGIGTD
jgi:hypothetical protein